ncbi:MAG: asparagine synthase-related protein [Verrucomicrobiota bacterium]
MEYLNCSEKKELMGDPVGHDNIYFFRDGAQIFHSTSYADLIQGLLESKHRLEINPAVVSYLLHDGLIPYPYSIYKNIHTLGVGDRANFSSDHTEIQFTNDFPYDLFKSRGDQKSSEEKLLSLLCESVSSGIGGHEAVLMLSSGKDSTAIALAAKEAGVENKIQCLTYGDREETSEGVYARKLCAQLGLRHAIITLPNDANIFKKTLIRYFENSACPLCDPATAPYTLALSAHGIKNSILLDGTGNDIYMGDIPVGNRFYLHYYYLTPVASWRHLERFIPFYSPMANLLCHQAKPRLLRNLFRRRESRIFYDSSVITHPYWNRLAEERERKYPFLDYRRFDHWLHAYAMDWRTFICRQYDDSCRQLRRQAAAVFGCRHLFPWANSSIAEYYFHLPPHEKYDIPHDLNKLLLRKMLRKYLDYDDAKMKKRTFEFDTFRFLKNNEAFVKEEIYSCKLWNKNIEPFCEHLWALMERQNRVKYSLRTLFLISGWRNHSRFLKS